MVAGKTFSSVYKIIKKVRVFSSKHLNDNSKRQKQENTKSRQKYPPKPAQTAPHPPNHNHDSIGRENETIVQRSNSVEKNFLQSCLCSMLFMSISLFQVSFSCSRCLSVAEVQRTYTLLWQGLVMKVSSKKYFILASSFASSEFLR